MLTMTDETLLCAGFSKQNKGTLITMTLMNKISRLAIVFECVFIFVFHHRNMLFYFWNTQAQSLFPSSYHGKIKSKNRKNIQLF